MPTDRLDTELLEAACRELGRIDDSFGRVITDLGFPPLWSREPNFATLIHIILEQQVSLASALAAFNKLKEHLGEITPGRVLALSDEAMKACYFSRQKTVYARELARAVAEGALDIEGLGTLNDPDARQELKKIKGIGDWTADIFLLMALLRPDVMPKGDLALHIAYRNLNGLARTPNSDEFQTIAERWIPYRASAARLLWHFYLSQRRAGS